MTLIATDWVTISALATAAGTLVLAMATYASVRSANRAARVAERTLLAGLRPVLVPSRLDDPPQKIPFADDRWLAVGGGHAAAEAQADAVYLAISVRNAGAGIAVLHGWRFYPERRLGNDQPQQLEEFTRLNRDIYVTAGDVGFWQGALRDPAAPDFAPAAEAIAARTPVTVDILYGDHDGGWLAAAGRHWNIDRDDPR